jgi:hypothetical protein
LHARFGGSPPAIVNPLIEMPSKFSKSRIAALRVSYKPRNFDEATLKSYVLDSDDRYTVCYCPIDVWPRKSDKIIFVGLTPGLSQMQRAAELYSSLPERKRSSRTAYADAIRETVAFAGPMRTNLSEMIEDIGMPQAFGACCADAL